MSKETVAIVYFPSQSVPRCLNSSAPDSDSSYILYHSSFPQSSKTSVSHRRILVVFHHSNISWPSIPPSTHYHSITMASSTSLQIAASDLCTKFLDDVRDLQ